MKTENNPLDDLFRESLKDLKVKPSQTARSRFVEEALRYGGKGWSNLFRWYNILSLAIVVTIVALLLYRNTPDNAKPPAPAYTNRQPVSPAVQNRNHAADPAKAIGKLETIRANPVSLNKAMIRSNPVSSKVVSGKTLVIKDQQSAIEQNEMVTAPMGSITGVNALPAGDLPATIQQTEEQNLSDVHPETIPESRVESGNAPPGQDIPGGVKPLPVKNDSTALADQPVFPPAKWELTPSLGYRIELNRYGTDNRFSHSFNLEGRLSRGRFFLLSGAGISISQGYQHFQVQYNDYLGQYDRLDSISFIWDEYHYRLVPSAIYTTQVQVWDSGVNYDSFSISKRYRQIRVPVMAGYNFLRSGKLTFDIQSGIEMDFYLNSREIAGAYLAGSKKVLAINPVSEDFVDTQFYCLFRLSAGWMLTPKILLELEPQCRYLLKPDDASMDKFVPGINASLKINF